MNTAKIMEFIKKNLLSLLCAVVAIAAIVASFWPVGGFIAQLTDTATQHAGVYQTLNGLLTKTRQLPLTDPTKTTPDPLKVFPTSAITEAGNKATGNVSVQSVDMVNAVVNLNEANHTLLVPDVFSNLSSDTPKLRFRDLYKLVLSNDPAISIGTEPLKSAGNKNLWNDILHGGMPPTETEIAAKKQSTYDNEYLIRIQYVNGQPSNKTQVDAQFATAAAKLPEQMKNAVALQKKVYISSDAFAINPNVGTGVNTPAVSDIWNAQLVLWIQQDVATAIAQANANATNIISAPVKRLNKLDIPTAPSPYLLATPVAAPQAGVPSALTPFEGGDTVQIPKLYNLSLTGRAGNSMYDVVKFSMTIDVDAAQIPAVLATLSQNRLIDVYNVEITSLDPNDVLKAGYIYGPLPVVQLSLKCEALFMRKWTIPMMPKQVREGVLGVAAPVPVTAAPTVPAQ